MSFEYVLTFISNSDPSSLSFRSAIWDNLRKEVAQNPRIQIIEICASSISDPSIMTTHRNLPMFVGWLPTLAVFDYDSWQRNQLVGSVYGGVIFGDSQIQYTATSQTPIEWFTTYIQKPKYVLIGIGNGNIGERFQRGPWNRFIEKIPSTSIGGIRVIWGEDPALATFPDEFRTRWLEWTPFVGIFTKSSWDRGEDLVGWVFQGNVDNHWSCDKVVTRSSTVRYNENDLFNWYLEIVSQCECVSCIVPAPLPGATVSVVGSVSTTNTVPVETSALSAMINVESSYIK